jgi:hypothetical protein
VWYLYWHWAYCSICLDSLKQGFLRSPAFPHSASAKRHRILGGCWHVLGIVYKRFRIDRKLLKDPTLWYCMNVEAEVLWPLTQCRKKQTHSSHLKASQLHFLFFLHYLVLVGRTPPATYRIFLWNSCTCVSLVEKSGEISSLNTTAHLIQFYLLRVGIFWIYFPHRSVSTWTSGPH